MDLTLRNYLKNEQGATMVEYAVILFFIALGVIVVVVALQDQSKTAFNVVANTVKDFGRIN